MYMESNACSIQTSIKWNRLQKGCQSCMKLSMGETKAWRGLCGSWQYPSKCLIPNPQLCRRWKIFATDPNTVTCNSVESLNALNINHYKAQAAFFRLKCAPVSCRSVYFLTHTAKYFPGSLYERVNRAFFFSHASVSLILPIPHPNIVSQNLKFHHWHTTKKELTQKLMTEQFLIYAY